MRAMSKTELLSARGELRRADTMLARARGIFISAGAVQGAAAVNAIIGRVGDLIARIDRALAGKP